MRNQTPDKLPIIDRPGFLALPDPAKVPWKPLSEIRLHVPFVSVRWQFKGKAPASIKAVFAVVSINFLGLAATSYAIPRWSPITSDATHSYPVHFKGSAGYFVEPWLGRYFEYGFWAHFALLALFFLMLWFHRDKIERIR